MLIRTALVFSVIASITPACMAVASREFSDPQPAKIPDPFVEGKREYSFTLDHPTFAYGTPVAGTVTLRNVGNQPISVIRRFFGGNVTLKHPNGSAVIEADADRPGICGGVIQEEDLQVINPGESYSGRFAVETGSGYNALRATPGQYLVTMCGTCPSAIPAPVIITPSTDPTLGKSVSEVVPITGEPRAIVIREDATFELWSLTSAKILATGTLDHYGRGGYGAGVIASPSGDHLVLKTHSKSITTNHIDVYARTGDRFTARKAVIPNTDDTQVPYAFDTENTFSAYSNRKSYRINADTAAVAAIKEKEDIAYKRGQDLAKRLTTRAGLEIAIAEPEAERLLQATDQSGKARWSRRIRQLISASFISDTEIMVVASTSDYTVHTLQILDEATGATLRTIDLTPR